MRAALLVVIVWTLPGGAMAEEPMAEPTDEQRAEATRLLEAGNQFYETGDYARALDAYRAAFEQTGAPGFLFNIAQSYRLAGNCVDAQSHYEQFLEAAPTSTRRAQVEELLGEMKQCVAERRARLIEPAVDPVGSDRAGGTTSGSESGARPGGDPASDRAVAGRGLRRFGLLTAAGGVALTGVGIVFAFDARSKSADLDGFSGEWTEREARTEREGKRARSAAIVMISAGGAAVTGGVVMYLLGARSDRAAQSNVTLDISASSAIVGFGGRF